MSLFPSLRTCIAAGEPASSNVSSHSHNHLSILYGEYIPRSRRHIPCRKKEQNRRHIPCRKKEQNRRRIPCRKKELSRYLPAIKGLCELFQPSGASGSYAQIFPTQTTYKQEIYTRKKLTMIRKHKLLQNRETVPLPRH